MLSFTALISAERRPDGVTHYCAPCVAGHRLSKFMSHNLLKLKCKYSQAQVVAVVQPCHYFIFGNKLEISSYKLEERQGGEVFVSL